jgi:4-hydroxybenzoate polyprenyltransferase
VLAFLREERKRGRRIVLATASWEALAQRVADHLGLFDEVLATTRAGNLKGPAKAAHLVSRWGERGFDYVGDSMADVPVWERARSVYVVDRTGRLAGGLPRTLAVERVFAPPRASTLPPALKALRPHQWAKNLLVFVPLIAGHRFADPASLAGAIQAFAAFCLLASGTYILNDLFDLQADRRHPRKRMRPLAAGTLSIPAGLALCVIALAGAAVLAWTLPQGAGVALAAYAVLTLAYSFGIKRVAMLDLVALASLYVIRIVAGGIAVGAPASFWLLAFAMFLFFSLALVKRYAELVSLEAEGISTAPGRGYGGHDAEIVLAMGAASAVVSALVLALYINGESVRSLYANPAMLWMLCPMLLYWISRMWLLASRGEMHDDPVLFAVRDATSYAVAVAGLAVVWAAI